MSQKITCSGALFYALNTKRFLFLHRTQSKQNNVWGLVGGRSTTNETPIKALQREIKEEIGDVAEAVKTIPLETFVSTDEKFNFHTYLLVVKQEFIPKLNDEHDGYAWASFSKWSKPLHRLRNNRKTRLISKIKNSI